MSPTGEEPTCPRFQPNIFDPSRCHDCLRQKHLHSGARESAQASLQQTSPAEPGNAAKTQTDSGAGRVPGVALTPIPSQEEERDTSSKDSDGASAVSSYCDVRGGRVDYQETSLCILSSDCNLYICDRDDGCSTDSCLDHSDYQESSGSGSAEDEYLPIRQHSPKAGMTRLDPPPHRTNPRAWTQDAPSRDGFSGRSGLREERQKRESGYFSLGRAAGATLRADRSPSGPFRHYERGHPVYSTENVDPKDTIPFRNPSLGVASERQKMTVLSEDPSSDILSPNADETAIEVEAQVGPRSPSPTPFKIAESLASTGRKGFSNSCSGGRPSSPSAYRHSGRFDTSRCVSPLQSRSSSPSRGNLPFRHCESAASVGRHASAAGAWTRGLEPGSQNSPHRSQRTYYESGTLPTHFKSLATSMTSQSSTVSDFRSALRKAEGSRTLNGCIRDGRSLSPSRRDRNPSGQMSLRRTELTTGPLDGHRFGSGASSPSPKASGGARDSCGSSPQRRNYCSSSQSLLRKAESVLSLNDRSHHGRCGSPIREGYDVKSQALLRNEITRNGMNDQADESQAMPPSRRSMASHSVLHKSESSPGGPTWDWHNQGSSPKRKDYQTPAQYQLRKTQDNNSFPGGMSESRSSSPLGRSHEMPSELRLRGHDSNSAGSLRSSHNAAGLRSLRRTEAGRSLNSTTAQGGSRNSSPSGKGYTDKPEYSVCRNATDGDSFHRKNTRQNSKSDSYYSSSSWRESTRSHHSSSLCRVASSSRQTGSGRRTASLTGETQRSPSVVRSGRPGHEKNMRDTPSRRPRTPSPSPQVQMQRHTSSQSSMESSESGPPLLRPSARSREEYVMMADVPKVKIIHQREAGSHTGPTQGQRPAQRQELFKPASHSLSKHPSRDWEDTGDAEWRYGSSGYLFGAHSHTSLQRPDSPAADEGRSGSSNYQRSEQTQPDLLNFKKGWMSKLDDNGEWKKHWFVLSDAGLKYYRDSSAEEKDDLDGEIDLKSCVNVSEFDVEKNYGFQIQTLEATFTLSAMTAGIRRNWIEVLKKCIRPSRSPDLTQLPDSSSDKENSHSRFGLPSHRPLSHHASVQSNPPASAPPTLRRFDYVELSPVLAASAPLSANQRDAGEGQGRTHHQVEERSTSSQWEALLSRKGTGAGSHQRARVEEEIEKKWAEIETLPLRDTSSRPPLGSWSPKQPANEALQREVASLRQQLEELQGRKGGGGGEGGGGGGKDGVSRVAGCGSEALCSRSLAAMEHAQRKALEELQRQHERQIKELENEKNRLLLEETQDTTRVIEALKKNHKEELEREVEKVRRLSSGVTDAQTLQLQQKSESQALQRELAGLSERYSQKCLELNRAEQNSAEREREICRKERDLEQLRKENQDLKTHLKEEMSRMQSTITDQRSEANKDRTCCELEVLLRMKENEIEYLHKEISCLRNELQFLNTEKRLACERYAEVHKELSGMRVRSGREIQNLKEHLSLAMAALQEGRKLGNSLDH